MAAAGAPSPAHIQLTPEQCRALELVDAGDHVFVTGEAGTGKSTVIARIIQMLHANKCHVAVTASSGIAACNIGGVTVHGFAGIGLGKGLVSQVIRKVRKRKDAVHRWRNTDVLIIDEISMLSDQVWELLDTVARDIRANDTPFGGIQVVAVGDFYQLPPVSGSFVFQSPIWKLMYSRRNVVALTTPQRQTNDQFIQLLHRARHGACDDADRATLLASGKALHKLAAAGIGATRLFSHNRDVRAFNKQQYERLPETTQDGTLLEHFQFDAIDEGSDKGRRLLCSTERFPTTLMLKIGAQVILLRNLDVRRGLVNGARGVVVGFIDNSNTEEDSPYPYHPIIRFNAPKRGTQVAVVSSATCEVKELNEVIATRQQLPLALAWALSIHKSQGMTIDALEVDISKCFASGQAYVALSRARSLDTLLVHPFPLSVIRSNSLVDAYMQSLDNKTKAKVE